MNRLLRGGLAIVFGCVVSVFATDPPEAPIQFTNITTSQFGIELAVTADLDADGLFDFVTLRTMRPFWNNGSNFFGGTSYNYSTDEQNPFAPVCADFDNDSDVDLLFVRQAPLNRRYTSMLWNRGSRNFTNTPLLVLPQISFGAAAAADYDNDGDLDFVLTGNTNAPNNTVGRNITRLYENVGGGSFIEVPQRFQPVEDGSVSWADYDKDGDFDLLVTGYTTNLSRGISVLYRNDAGMFVDSGLAFPSLVKDTPTPVTSAWGDYDNDDDLDLLMVGATVTGSRRALARIYRNEGGTFSDQPLALTNAVSDVRGNWADLDGDGDLDVIGTAASGTRAAILRNGGNGNFSPATTTQINTGQFLPGLFDGDGLTDLLWTRFDFRPGALRNITEATNTAPETPSGLAAVQNGGAVTFSWNGGADAEQLAGLTYNLRIGTTPLGSEVMPAMANATNGQRYIAALGNAGLRTNWTIRNFAVGTYYWSVQAIDHSYVGSTFAAEQSFTISNAPPVIEMFGVTNETPNSVTVSFRLNPNQGATEYYLVFTSTNHSGTNSITLRESGGVQMEHLLLSGLLPSTRYEVRVVASNQFGVNISSPRLFTTLPTAPLTEIALPFTILTQNPTMIAADLDHNGHLDVVLSGVTNTGIRTNIVFYNHTGVFSGPEPIKTPATSSGFWIDSAGDFNNDGLLDLVLANQNGGMIQLRDGDGFARERMPLNGAALGQIFTRDADNDGDLDVMYPSIAAAGALRLAVNTGISQMDYPTVTGLTRVPAVEWGDYDNDGDEDLLGFGSTNQSFSLAAAVTQIFRNEGGYRFTNKQAGLPGTLFGATWADYDNDRDLDVALIVSTNGPNHTVELYRNGGSNGFEKVETNLPWLESIVAVDWVDFDGDSRPDVILHQDLPAGDQLRIFLLGGTNQFIEHELNLPSNMKFEAVFADCDGDRMLDILLNVRTNQIQFRPRLFRNNLAATGAGPSVPTNLVAVARESFAELSWLFPTNESDAVFAPSFNLRIGRTPGGSEIMSAMSHPNTGARQLPQRGNAGQRATWALRDLPPGTYYWSVQSVDHAFNGSRFAPESTFEIAPQDRTPRILALEASEPGRYALTIDAPTRSNVLLETSTDLLEWLLADNVYIGSEPRTISVNNSGEAALFFRFYGIE